MQRIISEPCILCYSRIKPEDFVIATGITTEIRDFVRMAFAEVGIEVDFTGSGIDEKGCIK